jgi:cell division protease FtsH
MNDFMKNLLVWMILAAVTLVLFNQFQGSPEEARVGNPHRIDYTQFINEVKSDRVARVDMDGRTIHGFYTSGDHFMTFNPGDPGLVGDLLNHNVVITVPPPEKQSVLMQMFISWFPMLLLIAVWIFFMRSAGGLGGKNGPLSFGKSKARMQSEDQVKVTFEDVAGADEAKEEVHEIVDFLRDPEKYRKLGGKIPRGVLMVGPPGTGKTLLAKAIAGEAKVPFFTISGSDFVEMFVGVGASRVRDMFEQAKAHAPCIIFIDEIDAVGRSRGAGMGGGNDEREQTLNQMLVEMDGFEGNEGIIVIAATNRPDVLDPALLRPGRFDRQVTIGLPDVRGREQILKVHMRKVPMEEGVKPGAIARGTPGFSGADLANLVNEAALFAARMGKEKVNHEDFEKAKDKIIMGVERKSMVMKDDEKRLTAYHEAGHAIIGYLVPEHDPVYKVSIIPRGRALGVTMYLPEEDRYSYSKRRLESQLSSLYGGRIAEEMIFGADAVTTGASNDIERATSLARNMVMKWGMSDKLGPQMYEEEDNSNPFLGGGMSRTKALSPETGKLIDDEIHRFIETNYQRAERILKENSDKLHIMADALKLYETIDDVQIAQIMNEGRFPDAPEGWNDEIATDATGGEPPAQAQSVDASADAVLDVGVSADATNPPDAQPKWR